MPCTYTGSLEGDRALAAQEALDRRERMLCALCTHLTEVLGEAGTEHVLKEAARKADGLKKGDIKRWWDAHRKADAERDGR